MRPLVSSLSGLRALAPEMADTIFFKEVQKRESDERSALVLAILPENLLLEKENEDA